MGDYSEAYVAFDTSKLRNSVAMAQSGREGEVRFFGEIDNTPTAVRRLVKKLSMKHSRLTFCYEAGPTGYGLYRQIRDLGHECMVVAPSMIPKKAGDRVKNNRRDALSLARLMRAGELTAVWVPDERHEAMRELTRGRAAAVKDRRTKCQQVTAFLLRQGRAFPGRTTWGKAHWTWLNKQEFAHPEQRIVFEDLLLAVRHAEQRVARLEEAIRAAVPEWSLEPVVVAVMALRGMDMVSASAFLAEIGDLSRFHSPRELMGFLGLVPSEHSTGEQVIRGPITKAGNRRARRVLVESAWSYRYPPRIGRDKRARVEAAPEAVRAIAWKAQQRLYTRYRNLIRAGKLKTVAITALARELAGFIWAIGREITPPTARAN